MAIQNTVGKQCHRVLTCYYRPKPGGFCKRLFRAINALLDRGHTVHYLAVVRFPIDHPNCHFHRFPWPEEHTSGYLFWTFFHLFAPLYLLYLGYRYRIERLFAFGYNYSLFLQTVRILKRIPLTLFLRADTIENHKIKKRPCWLIVLEQIIEGWGIFGTRMYGVSKELTERTLARHKILLPAKDGVLRNDISKSQEVKVGKKTFQYPLHLACVGVLEPRKNQRFLLEVMKEISSEKAQLYLYGTGPDEDILRKKVAEENLTDRVRFMGWVPADKIWPNVDLLLMPSLHEGAPNAVLEALGQGVPVLASNIPEHMEILPKSCLVVVDSSYTLNCKIEQFVSNPLGLAERFAEQNECAEILQFDWDFKIVELITAEEPCQQFPKDAEKAQ